MHTTRTTVAPRRLDRLDRLDDDPPVVSTSSITTTLSPGVHLPFEPVLAAVGFRLFADEEAFHRAGRAGGTR